MGGKVQQVKGGVKRKDREVIKERITAAKKRNKMCEQRRMRRVEERICGWEKRNKKREMGRGEKKMERKDKEGAEKIDIFTEAIGIAKQYRKEKLWLDK